LDYIGRPDLHPVTATGHGRGLIGTASEIFSTGRCSWRFGLRIARRAYRLTAYDNAMADYAQGSTDAASNARAPGNLYDTGFRSDAYDAGKCSRRPKTPRRATTSSPPVRAGPDRRQQYVDSRRCWGAPRQGLLDLAPRLFGRVLLRPTTRRRARPAAVGGHGMNIATRFLRTPDSVRRTFPSRPNRPPRHEPRRPVRQPGAVHKSQRGPRARRPARHLLESISPGPSALAAITAAIVTSTGSRRQFG